MNNNEQRLITCFHDIFPELSPEQIQNSTTCNVEGWDSITAINLVVVVAEEFDLDMDSLEFETLLSFKAFLDLVI